MNNGDLQALVNLKSPEATTLRAAPFKLTLSDVPFYVDFRALNGSDLAGSPFRPSGVFIDNTQGTANCVVLFQSTNYRIICKEGEIVNLPYPSPVNSTVAITGEGAATIIFVDYPVDPYESRLTDHGGGGGGGVTAWGSIVGSLHNQGDLQGALDLKADLDYVNTELTNVVDYVNSSDSTLQAAIDGKVDKVPGKGLSEVDFTSADKAKLDSLSPGGGSFSGALVQRATAFTYTANALVVPLPFDSVIYDTSSLWDSTNSQFVIPAGVSKVRVCAGYEANTGSSTARFELQVVNAADVIYPSCDVQYERTTTSANRRNMVALSSAVIPVSEGDTFRFRFRTATAAAYTQILAVPATYFSIEIVG